MKRILFLFVTMTLLVACSSNTEEVATEVDVVEEVTIVVSDSVSVDTVSDTL